MLAKDIDVTDIKFDPLSGFYRGTVSMRLETGQGGVPAYVYYQCKTRQQVGCPSSLVLYGLIKDAVIQARRMPGFRSEDRKVRVDISSVSFAAA